MKAHARNRTVSIPQPHILRLAVISALGVYAATSGNSAQASCNTNGDGHLAYQVCQGADGKDESSSEKKGKDGESVVYNETEALTANASSSLSFPVTGNVPGVLMLYSRGGKGVDEGGGMPG